MALPDGVGRVETLLMQIEIDVLGMELGQQLEQASQGPPESIDRPGQHHIEVAAGNALHQGVEARTRVPALGTRDAAVLENAHHRPIVTAGDGF
jgi:hypothetical protein